MKTRSQALIEEAEHHERMAWILRDRAVDEHQLEIARREGVLQAQFMARVVDATERYAKTLKMLS